MGKLNKIFLWAFIILSILPILEFTLFQWRNENRIGLNTTSTISVISYPSSTSVGYVVYYLPSEINSFTDYVLNEYSYGVIDQAAVNLQGLAKPIFLTMAMVTREMASSTATGPFLVNLIAVAILLSRSVYVACMLLLAYLIIFPVIIVTKTLKGRSA